MQNNQCNPWQQLGILPFSSTPLAIRYFIKDIVKNLERLLNARQSYFNGGSPQFDHLLNYGLADLSQFNPESETQRQLLCQQLQAGIAQHEPRLEQISVSLLTKAADIFNVLHFRISALITELPNQPTVELDSVFNLRDLTFRINAEEGV